MILKTNKFHTHIHTSLNTVSYWLVTKRIDLLFTLHYAIGVVQVFFVFACHSNEGNLLNYGTSLLLYQSNWYLSRWMKRLGTNSKWMNENDYSITTNVIVCVLMCLFCLLTTLSLFSTHSLCLEKEKWIGQVHEQTKGHSEILTRRKSSSFISVLARPSNEAQAVARLSLANYQTSTQTQTNTTEIVRFIKAFVFVMDVVGVLNGLRERTWIFNSTESGKTSGRKEREWGHIGVKRIPGTWKEDT
jgi:hypothetical protein